MDVAREVQPGNPATPINTPIRQRIRVVSMRFADWRREIAPLWHMEGSYRAISYVVNGYGQLQYTGHELFSRLRLYPLAAELDGKRVGWTSTYNISDHAVRLRGVYVLPEYRACGIARTMIEHALGIWPSPWDRCFIYARLNNLELYRRLGFAIVPGHRARSHRWGAESPDGEIIQMVRWFRDESGVRV
jgi:ribosomal protein S18 acetylase RimI-like enzyme